MRKRAAEAAVTEDDRLERLLERVARLEAFMPRIEASALVIVEARDPGRLV